MADLVTTVLTTPASDAVFVHGTAGETVSAGQSVYRNAADGKYYLADADAAATADGVGIMVNNPGTDQPCTVQVGGGIDVGVTVVVGETYVVSTNAGGIAPISDLGSGDYVTHLGVGTAADNIKLGVFQSQIAKA